MPTQDDGAIDIPRVEAWISQQVAGTRAPFRFEMVANGRSNLTYRVEGADGRQIVLRRPPLGDLLPTAHDVAREHRLIAALAPTSVPVPFALGLCVDSDVTGAPFYLMEFVDGHVLRTVAEVEEALPVPARRAVTEALVGTLAAIHEVDLEETGLDSLARPDAYVQRQLKRWRGQLHASVGARADAGRGVAYLDAAHDALAVAVPQESGPVLVHGDFRLGNCIVSSDGAVRAVLDWETCTLGEPLADLATLLVGWNEAGDEDLLGLVDAGIVPTAAPGFPGRSGVVAAYAAASGRDVSDLPFFFAFAWWRMACVLHGVTARYRAGSGGGESGRLDVMERRADGATELARRALADAGITVGAG